MRITDVHVWKDLLGVKSAEEFLGDQEHGRPANPVSGLKASRIPPPTGPAGMLRVLVAEDNPDASRPLARIIRGRLEPMLGGLHFQIDIVTTLAGALEISQDANATIIDLMLDDAGPDEVIAAIPKFRKPVIVLTANTDPAMHTRCVMAGASYVFIKAEGQERTLCRAILHCLSQDVSKEAQEEVERQVLEELQKPQEPA